MKRQLSSTLLAIATLVSTTVPALAGPSSHSSWIDPSTLASDPKALCDDVGLGHNVNEVKSSLTQNNVTHDKQNNIGSTSSFNSSSSKSSSSNFNKSGGGGGFNVNVLGLFGAGANGSGGSTSSSSNTSSSAKQSSFASKWDRSSDKFSDKSYQSTYEQKTATLVTGKNCSSFVEAAAARDINYENNQTQRYLYNSSSRSEAVDSLLRW